MPAKRATVIRETRIYSKRARRKDTFRKELLGQISLHKEGPWKLASAVTKPQEPYTRKLVLNWISGKARPRWVHSFEILNRIEERYDLPKNHFRNILLPNTPTEQAVKSVSHVMQDTMRWHLPKNFDLRPKKERDDILSWISLNVMPGATEYGQYLRRLSRTQYRLRLPAILDVPASENFIAVDGKPFKPRIRRTSTRYQAVGVKPAPQLIAELKDLIRFKRLKVPPAGMHRVYAWTIYTASKQLRVMSSIFGAFIAPRDSALRGRGVPVSKLTLALYVLPKFWDWYLNWRVRRRGFFTGQDLGTLVDAMSLMRPLGGWLRQRPGIAKQLSPIKGLVTSKEVIAIQNDWDAACNKALFHLQARSREIRPIIRKAHDTSEGIQYVLRTKKPLDEYRKIEDEILRRQPNRKTAPLAAAEAMRAYLVIRMSLHLGLRQRNLRELLICMPGEQKKAERFLSHRRVGEMRWSQFERGWEVFIPAIAFKNWYSSFFCAAPFRMILPNVAGLYKHIDDYLKFDRPVLVGGYNDPGTFFTRTMRSNKGSGVYHGPSFNMLWKDAIRRYGIYNPYTRKGALKGLLPHGPNAARAVIATHVLKQTVSYELAAFAIQDTPEVVKRTYGNVLPEEKSALAANVTNSVWHNRGGKKRKH